MEKLNNFINSFEVLKSADFDRACDDDIYRMGIIGQFNLTFELAWKALQAVLRLHGVEQAKTGSPREILQLGYKTGFIDDRAVWLTMLEQRNTSVHIYDEKKADELVLLISGSFIGAFEKLGQTLAEKLAETAE